MKCKVALVVPLTTDFMKVEDAVKNTAKVEYLAFEYIAEYLRKEGIKVDIIDSFVEDLSIDEVVARIDSKDYDYVCFTIMSSDYIRHTKLILNRVKNNQFKTVVGGIYASLLREKILKETMKIDYVVVGEGEKALLELVNGGNINNIDGLIWRNNERIIINNKRTLLTDEELEKLPFPRRENLDKINSFKIQKEATILASRGCYGDCYFCGVAGYYNAQNGSKWRARSPESIIEEMKCLKEKHGVEYIYFADDEFIGPGKYGKERALKFADLLEKEKLEMNFCIYSRVDSVDYEVFKRLQENGLDHVFLGIEFGVERLLKFYNKGITTEQSINAIKTINKLRIFTSIGYIMFEPTMTIDELKENMHFYFKYIDIRLMILSSKIGIYEDSKAYQKLQKMIDIDNVSTFSESIGDIYEYRFLDEKVDAIFKILNNELVKIKPSIALTNLRLLEAEEEFEGYNTRRWTNQLHQLIDKLIDNVKSEEQSNIEKISKIFGETLKQWDENFKFKEVKKLQAI